MLLQALAQSGAHCGQAAGALAAMRAGGHAPSARHFTQLANALLRQVRAFPPHTP